jgi:hypothetical protein
MTMASSIVRVRALLSLLFSLLIAVGLAVGGYAALWSLRREPITETAPATPTTPAPRPAIDRRPDSPDYARVPAAAPERGDAPLVPLTIVVRNVPATWPTTHAGVAVAPRRGGDGLAWLPIAAATRTDDGWMLRTDVASGEEYVAALATTRAGALRSFLAQASQKVDAAANLAIDGAGRATSFRLPEGAERRGPFRLLRDGDAGWLPAEAPTGLVLAPATATTLWLGAGSYRLVDVLHEARSQSFRVPQDGDVTISAALAAAAAGPK